MGPSTGFIESVDTATLETFYAQLCAEICGGRDIAITAQDAGLGSEDGSDSTIATKILLNAPLDDSNRLIDLARIALPCYSDFLASAARIGIWTSGTTGRPSLIWHSIPTLTRTAYRSEKFERDRWGFCFSSTSFAGLQVFLQAYANNNSICHLSGSNIEAAQKAIEQLSISRLSGTPTFLKMLCASDRIYEKIRSVTLGGEGVSRSLVDQIHVRFPNAKIHNVYASTEAGTLFTSVDDCFEVPSVSRNRVRIVRDQLAVHQTLVSDTVLETAAPERLEGDFFLTGDIVEIINMSPLRFRIRSRVEDWINVGGQKVNPNQIEIEICRIPEVADAVVYSQKNSVVGNLVCADIQLVQKDLLSVADIKKRLSAKLNRESIPQIIRFVDHIPTNATGKKIRHVLDSEK